MFQVDKNTTASVPMLFQLSRQAVVLRLALPLCNRQRESLHGLPRQVPLRACCASEGADCMLDVHVCAADAVGSVGCWSGPPGGRAPVGLL